MKVLKQGNWKMEDKEKLYNLYFQRLHHKTLLCVLHSFDNLC